MVDYFHNSLRQEAKRFIARYKELLELGYMEDFILDELQNYIEECDCEEEWDEELPDILQLQDDVKVEIYRIHGLTEDQKQEITTIVQDAIYAYE